MDLSNFNRPLLIAHRGARSLAPENTLAAIRRGLEEKADLWETDVMATLDGNLILFHDDDLTRTTDAETRFPNRRNWITSGFTLEELRSLDAGSWYEKTDPFGQIAAGNVTPGELKSYCGEKIPTLEEGLIFTRDADWPVNLELKDQMAPVKDFPMTDMVLETIRKVGIDESLVIISSFHHGWLREIQRKNPRIAVQALIGNEDETSLDWGTLEFDTYNALFSLVDEKKIRELSEKNISVNLFTINNTEDMRRFSAAGAAGIFTDFPQLLYKQIVSGEQDQSDLQDNKNIRNLQT